MHFSYWFHRLLHRKSWLSALDCSDRRIGLPTLCRKSAQTICEHRAAIVRLTGEIRSGCDSGRAFSCMEEISGRMERLRRLLPYASSAQQRVIADAQRTAQFAKALVPRAPKGESRTQITYYSVYIPTLKGHFYYLGTEPYHPGDIVVIPFGGENMTICGIVEEVLCRDYWKMPLPLWKMKYIASKAPEEIAREYRRLTK